VEAGAAEGVGEARGGPVLWCTLPCPGTRVDGSGVRRHSPLCMVSRRGRGAGQLHRLWLCECHVGEARIHHSLQSVHHVSTHSGTYPPPTSLCSMLPKTDTLNWPQEPFKTKFVVGAWASAAGIIGCLPVMDWRVCVMHSTVAQLEHQIVCA